MRVLLVGNYLPDAQRSMQRFTRLMERGLREAGHEVMVCRPIPIAGRAALWRGAKKWTGYVDKFILFPFTLQDAMEWADVVHICDHSNAMYVRHFSRRPHLVTCHDLIAIRSATGELKPHGTRWTGRQLQRLILRSLERAQHVVCVSRATERDLLRSSRLNSSAISVIHNGLDYGYPAPVDATKHGVLGLSTGQRFLLHVGGNQWYKNRLGLLHIFRSVKKYSQAGDLSLVMAGEPFTREMRAYVAENCLEDSVIELTDVAEEGLHTLYSTAAMMLFPSLYEGFGWPIIEAQAYGCPVVTSNRPPMDEIGGQGAVYVDPENIDSAGAAIVESLSCAPALRELAVRNVERFRPAVMINAYVDLYRRL